MEAQAAEAAVKQRSTIAALEASVAELSTARSKMVEETELMKKKLLAVAKKKQAEFLAKLSAKEKELEQAVQAAEGNRVAAAAAAKANVELEVSHRRSFVTIDSNQPGPARGSCPTCHVAMP